MSWKVGEDKLVFKTRIFELCSHEVELPKKNFKSEFYFIRSGDWCNVLPITPEGEIVFISQFRPAVREQCLEIPGGMCDASDTSMQHSAERELLEETGYVSNNFEHLISVHPNPAILTNRCHLFVAFDAVPSGETKLDHGEDISVVKIPIKEAQELLFQGKITHSLVVNALAMFLVRYQAKLFSK
jgi:ADP-ribose pyrophosphatase